MRTKREQAVGDVIQGPWRTPAPTGADESERQRLTEEIAAQIVAGHGSVVRWTAELADACGPRSYPTTSRSPAVCPTRSPRSPTGCGASSARQHKAPVGADTATSDSPATSARRGPGNGEPRFVGPESCSGRDGVQPAPQSSGEWRADSRRFVQLRRPLAVAEPDAGRGCMRRVPHPALRLLLPLLLLLAHLLRPLVLGALRFNSGRNHRLKEPHPLHPDLVGRNRPIVVRRRRDPQGTGIGRGCVAPIPQCPPAA